MKRSEWFLIPNLLSLSRILFVPPIGYFLQRGDSISTWWCVLLLVLAGVTDFLDGFLARRQRLTSELGLILDPLADKMLAVAIIVLLVPFRHLPVWLAVIILSRDLLIMAGAGVLLKTRQVTIPSQLAGKYMFFFVVILIGSAIIRYDFGVRLLTWPVVALAAVSIGMYARSFLRVLRRQALPLFQDRPIFFRARIASTVLIMGIWLVKLILSFWS
ncbi:MAG TPA: CDP-alcohol phosphatidyltransferase family protein [Candidatus Acidoferrum sp.]|nr:CDP-alcohol phosphatidyltransferase family protein [Candidatus Acidoferrum sp.]